MKKIFSVLLLVISLGFSIFILYDIGSGWAFLFFIFLGTLTVGCFMGAIYLIWDGRNI